MKKELTTQELINKKNRTITILLGIVTFIAISSTMCLSLFCVKQGQEKEALRKEFNQHLYIDSVQHTTDSVIHLNTVRTIKQSQ